MITAPALRAHVGQPYCPAGVPHPAADTSDIVDRHNPARTRVMLLAPVVRDQKGEFRDVIGAAGAQGLCPRPRGRSTGRTGRRCAQTGPQSPAYHQAVVDRLVIDEKIRVRLSDSVETALRWAGLLTLHHFP